MRNEKDEIIKRIMQKSSEEKKELLKIRLGLAAISMIPNPNIFAKIRLKMMLTSLDKMLYESGYLSEGMYKAKNIARWVPLVGGVVETAIAGTEISLDLIDIENVFSSSNLQNLSIEELKSIEQGTHNLLS
jgi:hypothetical protein